MTVELHLEHLSGRWNRPPSLLAADIRESARSVDLMTFTEVADGKRPHALHVLGDGWTVLQDRTPWQSGEVAIVARNDVWQVLRWRTVVLGPDLGPGLAITGIVALLSHVQSGATLVVSTTHLPSAVEGAWRRRTRRVLTHQRAVQNQRRVIRYWYRTYKADAALVINDWNLPANKLWPRRWIRAAWPGLRLPARIPTVGSHGTRLIDWPIGKGIRGLAMRVRRLTPASDHRRIRVTGTITRRTR